VADNKQKLVKAARGKQMVQMKALWSCSRYVVTRDLWKGITVPALTFGNAVLVQTATEARLESIQREVIRYAIGCSFNCAREFVEGEGAMSTFRERETVSKLLYFLRLQQLPDHRWPVLFQNAKESWKVKTRLDRRREFLTRSIGLDTLDWRDSDSEGGQLRLQIKRAFLGQWLDKMKKKSSLELYRQQKKQKGKVDKIYDNSRGSRLLADARAGMLRTRQFQARVMSCDVTCQLCKTTEEDIEHVVLQCPVLGLRQGVSLSEALGLGNGLEEVHVSKYRLSEWMVRKQALM
jgi:hypothetical protein